MGLPQSRLAAWLTAFALLTMCGCAAVGPDYAAPSITSTDRWRNAGTGIQQLPGSSRAPSPAAWWQQFADPVLTDLIQRAFDRNPDVRQARARVREARARLGLSRADLVPGLDGSGSVSRSRSGGNSAGGEFDNYIIGFDAGWEMDIFGGARRAVEAARADLDASVQDLYDAGVSLAAEVALNYVQVRTLQARLSVAEDSLSTQQETYQITVWRFEAGLSDQLASRQALYNLASTRARIPVLRVEMESAMNRIAVLMGLPPGQVHAGLSADGSIPAVPERIAIGLPAETLRQRPDVAAAERRLAAQTARIGVAEAELYPKFRLSGVISWRAPNSADLFASGSQSYSLGPGFSWRLFDGGAVRRGIDVQEAVQQQSMAAYEQTVLLALEEVENALKAFVQEQSRTEHLRSAVSAAQQALTLSQDKYRAGLSDFSDVLEAQRSVLSFEDSLVQSRAAVVTHVIALYKAMGGGWQTLDPLSKKAEQHAIDK